MTPQELKNSILAMAFQGKLTNHLETDSPIESLINMCATDKKKAIQEGKHKKEAFRGAVDNTRFAVPQHWCIMHISDMSLYQEGPGILAKDFRASGVPLIRISGMQTNRVTLDGCNYLDPDMVEEKWKHFKLDVGDILISTSASTDKVCEVYDDCAGAIPYTGQIRFKMYGKIFKEYFKWFVQSPEYIKQIDEQKTGAAIKHYGPTHLKKMLIPIAPLEEQVRIVTKIEELLPYIDRYEQAWIRLENFSKRFPDDMKKSILQLAIQGKLVEQRPEEGTAEELYQQIQEEKQRLIRTGKIKKEKPLPEIAEDEMPFEVPRSWMLLRLGELCNIVNGFTPLRSNESFWKDATIPWFTVEDIHLQGRRIYKTSQAINECALAANTERILPAGTVLLCCTASVGEYAITEMPLTTNQQFNGLVIRNEFREMLYSEFLFQIAPIFKKLLLNTAGKTTFNFVSVKKLSNFILPIPPFAEQKRIVEKLEELLPLCKKLK